MSRQSIYLKSAASRIRRLLGPTGVQLKKLRHVYLGSVLIWYTLIGWKSFLTLDLIFLLTLPAFFLYGKGIEYFKRFFPFVAIVLVYDSLRSIVPLLVHNIHFQEMIAFDKWIGGGQVPTVTLQHWLYHGQLHWFDYYFYLSYMLHFVAPYVIRTFDLALSSAWLLALYYCFARSFLRWLHYLPPVPSSDRPGWPQTEG